MCVTSCPGQWLRQGGSAKCLGEYNRRQAIVTVAAAAAAAAAAEDAEAVRGFHLSPAADPINTRLFEVHP